MRRDDGRSFSGILRSVRVLVGESVYEDAQVSVLDGRMSIEFDADDIDDIMIDLDELGIRRKVSDG